MTTIQKDQMPNQTVWTRRQKNKRHRVTPIPVTKVRNLHNGYMLVSYLRGYRVCGAIVHTKNLEQVEK